MNDTSTKEGLETIFETFKRDALLAGMARADWDKTIDKVKALAIEALEKRLQIEKPRRKIVMLAKFEADDWDTMQGTFSQLETQIAMHDALPSRSVSGGYSSGHIYVCDVDQEMTHDAWAADLEAHLSSLPKVTP